VVEKRNIGGGRWLQLRRSHDNEATQPEVTPKAASAGES